MPRTLSAYSYCQVFLNHPFDEDFEILGFGMAFAVVAAGLLPVSALDLNVPDRPRLEMLVEAIRHCHYSAHDLSRCTGEGLGNLARMNMPLEMGMALFYGLDVQRAAHRCAFFVSSPHAYQAFASDLAGLDPKCHHNDSARLVAEMYDWLRAVVPPALFNSQPTVNVVEKYREFQERLRRVRGSGTDGRASYHEAREVMYMVCTECRWWDWRETRLGKEQFPTLPMSWVS